MARSRLGRQLCWIPLIPLGVKHLYFVSPLEPHGSILIDEWLTQSLGRTAVLRLPYATRSLSRYSPPLSADHSTLLFFLLRMDHPARCCIPATAGRRWCAIRPSPQPHQPGRLRRGLLGPRSEQGVTNCWPPKTPLSATLTALVHPDTSSSVMS